MGNDLLVCIVLALGLCGAACCQPGANRPVEGGTWWDAPDRAEKVARLANAIPEQAVFGPEEGDLLLVTWGGTFGAVRTAVTRANAKGHNIAHAHLRYINPFPRNLGDILRRYRRIMVPEQNNGQLAFVLRGTFGMDNIVSYPKLHARPFKIGEVYKKLEELVVS